MKLIDIIQIVLFCTKIIIKNTEIITKNHTKKHTKLKKKINNN